jgi:hypothetical protein
MNKRVDIYETDDGQVSIATKDESSALVRSPRKPVCTQAAIVENKLLGATQINTYKSPTQVTVRFTPAVRKDGWSIVEHDAGTGAGPITTERHIDRWRVAEGGIMNSPIDRCIEIENHFFQQKLILDLSKPHRPRRAIVPLTNRLCRCPLEDFCLPERMQ